MNERLTPVSIEIDGKPVLFRVFSGGQEYHINSDGVSTLSISACLEALKMYDTQFFPEAEGPTYLVIDMHAEHKWLDISWSSIFVTHGEPNFEIEFIVNAAMAKEDAEVNDIIYSCVDGSAFRVISVGHNPDESSGVARDTWHGWEVSLSIDSDTTKRFDELLGVWSYISREVFLPRESLTVPFLILRTIQRGEPAVLVGQAESEWLEVKSSAYELRNLHEAHWKLELALDVSQFANSSQGGLLLVGYHTKRISGRDTIDKMVPIPVSQTRLQTYGDVLRNKIHPPISGLEVGSVSLGNGEIVYVYIPLQQEENKPYLVTGSLVSDRYIASGISIARRQGDSSVPVTAQEIHAALAVGRALMRGRE